jgi:small subunit ribosomal protein S8
MAHTDPIADMLTRIRNGAKALRRSVDIPGSKSKKEIARILADRHFIKKYVFLDDGRQGTIKVLLNYRGTQSSIRGIERVSTPGRRIYKKSVDVPRVKNGLGIAIISTSKGVMTDRECRKMNLGGEIICRVW